MENRTMQLSEGATLQNGKYQIEKVLGQGGFGITYLARQEILEREVCIKEFFMRDFCNRSETNSAVTLGTSANKELIERYLNKFIKEARTIAALDHPNIIHIHDIFKENDTAYYVMDYIEGESLSEIVKHRGALSEEEAVKYIRSVADALKYVHQRSINHLDVKPGNIMVRHSDSHVFLLDFGLSKQYDTAGNQTSSTPLGISHGFAPIEQYSPEGIKEFSPQTDIYSLGATLYYLITGTTPPPASELFASELEGFPATVSVSVKEAITKAMKPQKKERTQSIDEFMILLETKTEKNKTIKEDLNIRNNNITHKNATEDTIAIPVKNYTTNNKTSNYLQTKQEDDYISKVIESRKEFNYKKLVWIILTVLLILFIFIIINSKNISTNKENHSVPKELNVEEKPYASADVKGNNKLGSADIADLQNVITQSSEEKEEPYTMVEQMPQFPGGPTELMKYISTNLHYPANAQENGIQGRVILRFVVSAEGNVEDVTVLRSLDPYCDKEAVRVIQSLPKWIPGKHNGRNVPVYYTCPIVFRLQ